jgi:hypothetical protein
MRCVSILDKRCVSILDMRCLYFGHDMCLYFGHEMCLYFGHDMCLYFGHDMCLYFGHEMCLYFGHEMCLYFAHGMCLYFGHDMCLYFWLQIFFRILFVYNNRLAKYTVSARYSGPVSSRISKFWINAATATIRYKISCISFRRLTSCHIVTRRRTDIVKLRGTFWKLYLAHWIVLIGHVT